MASLGLNELIRVPQLIAAWWHYMVTWIGSTLTQVMACCLMAPSHNLNHYWLIINGVLCHVRPISQEMLKMPIHRISLKNTLVKLLPHPLGANELMYSCDLRSWKTFGNIKKIIFNFVVTIVPPGGHFKNNYELLNLRALKFSPVNKIHIFQCMGKIFYEEFQRYPLKFHTKYLTYTLKDKIFIQHWIFKSS